MVRHSNVFHIALHVLFRYSRLLFILLLTFLSFSCGSGSEAPPVSIPAPAPENIQVSAPDVTGLVTVTGVPGAVTGGNTVQVTNLTASQASLLRTIEAFFLRTAWATLETTVETTASDDGSFSVQIAASVGDTLRIISIDPESGEQSDPLDVTVPAT